jgi:Fur family transcriptional regulator, peroxide stress response regulator
MLRREAISKQPLEHFEEVCRNAGVKVTQQRIEIYRELVQTEDHPDAETVYNRVRERMPTVSLDTVYRTLWLFNDLELIHTLGASRERARFDANLSQHHHFVCSRCGLTRDFYDDGLDQLKIPDAAKALGQVEATKVEVRGVCFQCLNEVDSNPETKKKEEDA